MKIVMIDQMRAIEDAAVQSGISLDHLMETAGLRVAEKAMALLGGAARGEHITVLIGPGNNGGDGLVAARHLSDWGARVHVCLCAQRKPIDPKLALLVDRVMDVRDLEIGPGITALQTNLAASRVVIDAVLGAAKGRRIGDTLGAGLLALIEAKSRNRALVVLAVDVPSGLDADTGECDPLTPVADVTVTLGFPKRGLFLAPGAAKVGRLEIVDIGIPPDLAPLVGPAVTTRDWASSLLPPRPAFSNKGTFGRLMVVAGSERYVGAAYLCAAAAIRAGAGLVTLATPRSLVPTLATLAPEATLLPLEERRWGLVDPVRAAAQVLGELSRYDAMVLGCGLGQTPEAKVLVRDLVMTSEAAALPTLLDADGLNAVASIDRWWTRTMDNIVLAPHPGEMQRLLGGTNTIEQIQADRLSVAEESANVWKKTLVLKGAYTVVASANGEMRVNPFANAALATAGTGDVLAGIVGGLLAQALSGFHASALGVYVHALAAEALAPEIGEGGLAASELVQQIPRVIKRLKG